MNYAPPGPPTQTPVENTSFVAYRLSGDPEEAVALRSRETVLEELKSADAMPDEQA
jgi:hypothetical protein